MAARWAKVVANLLTDWCGSQAGGQSDFTEWTAKIQRFQQSLPDELVFQVCALFFIPCDLLCRRFVVQRDMVFTLGPGPHAMRRDKPQCDSCQGEQEANIGPAVAFTVQVLEHVCLRTILVKGTPLLHRAAVAARLHNTSDLGSHLTLANELLGPAFPLACHVIPDPTQINSLDISWNSIDRIGAANFAHCLTNMSDLRRLDVSSNFLRTEGMAALAHGLMYATTLTHLNLSGNAMCADGAVHLAPALSALERLEVLDLSENDLCIAAMDEDDLGTALTADDAQPQQNVVICDRGVIALNKALEQCTALRELVLSGNMLGVDGVRVRPTACGATLTNAHCSADTTAAQPH
jgi:hypothetical protein